MLVLVAKFTCRRRQATLAFSILISLILGTASIVAQVPEASSTDAAAQPKDVVSITAAKLPAAPVAMDWTQAGDGVLIADADGGVTMWQLRRDAPAPANAAKPAGAAAKKAAEAALALSVAWQADAKQSQVTITGRDRSKTQRRCVKCRSWRFRRWRRLKSACCPDMLSLCRVLVAACNSLPFQHVRCQV